MENNGVRANQAVANIRNSTGEKGDRLYEKEVVTLTKIEAIEILKTLEGVKRKIQSLVK